MKSFLKQALNATLKQFGYEFHRIGPTPAFKLLGMVELDIQTIIDVGANEGQFARYISGYFPAATLYCFEPVPEAFATLKIWAETQDGRVIPINCALGETTGKMPMIKHDHHTSSSSFLQTTSLCERHYPETNAQSKITVECDTLDNALMRFGGAMRPEFLVKLDVQGYESRVIRGGKDTFAKAKAVVLEVSLVPLYESQPTFAEVVRLMDESGFNYAGSLEQACNAEGKLLSIDAVFLRRS